MIETTKLEKGYNISKRIQSTMTSVKRSRQFGDCDWAVAFIVIVTTDSNNLVYRI